MEIPVLCPYCGDMKIERVPEAKLFAEHLLGKTTPVPGFVFHCSRWHIFATFTPLDPSRQTE